MSLVLDHVTYRYPSSAETAGALAVRDACLELEPGSITLICGVTGSGKSTLLRLAAGLVTPDEGSVQVDGEPVKPAMVGMVFQRPESQLFADTVRQDVAFGPRNLGMPQEDALTLADDMLRSVGLDPAELGERSPFALSGGQARRVAIAGVLALQRRYLLFDEPTAGLDGAGKRFMRELFARLRADGIAIAVVSHDLDFMLPLVDRVALMRAGRVVWQGDAAGLVGDPYLFSRAGLRVPSLLAFQQDLGCMDGGLSLDVHRVAHWALDGFDAAGPLGHVHSHGCGDGED